MRSKLKREYRSKRHPGVVIKTKRKGFLSQEQEADLVRVARTASCPRERADAKRMVIDNIMPLAMRAANKRSKGRRRDDPSMDDMMQSAFLGLCEAFDRFEPERGHRFSTYALFWVEHFLNVQRDAERSDLIKTRGGWRMVVLKKYVDAGKNITAEELSKLAGCSVEMAAAIITSYHMRPIDADVVKSLAGEGETSDAAIAKDGQAWVDSMLSVLTEREESVVRRCVLADDEETLKELGEVWGVSRERIRQVRNEAIATLRQSMTRHDIEHARTMGFAP